MKPEVFFKKYFLEKVNERQFKKIRDKDLLAEGILNSLDIVILSTKIKKKLIGLILRLTLKKL